MGSARRYELGLSIRVIKYGDQPRWSNTFGFFLLLSRRLSGLGFLEHMFVFGCEVISITNVFFYFDGLMYLQLVGNTYQIDNNKHHQQLL